MRLILKGKMVEYAKKLQLEDEEQHLGAGRFLNSRDRCIVCGFERAFDTQTRMIEPLVGHHVQYFPAVIAWVHYHCHRKIHNNPITSLIQYEDGDSRRYYGKKVAQYADRGTSWR